MKLILATNPQCFHRNHKLKLTDQILKIEYYKRLKQINPLLKFHFIANHEHMSFFLICPYHHNMRVIMDVRQKKNEDPMLSSDIVQAKV